MNNQIHESLSITPHVSGVSMKQKMALMILGISLAITFFAWANRSINDANLWLYIVLGTSFVGATWFIYEEYKNKPEGIKNTGNWHRSLSSRGVYAWILAIILTTFYVFLYWYPEYLQGLIALFNPLSQLLRGGKNADQWFVYGAFYTISVLIMGIKMMYKYRHNRYQIIRTGSVMFFQLGFAFLIPAFLVSMQQPEIYFNYFWPLSYYQGTPDAFNYYSSIAGTTKLGLYYFAFGLGMFFIGTPILTYYFGKRWYCSWVCGCGGLAETSGDPFRHLSDKSLKAWKIERYMIYAVLIIALSMTALLWANVWTGQSFLGEFSQKFYKFYSFAIGSAFSGVVGVGFYPILGSRVWCRFGCPMAAWLGIWQKYFSRFRITTNGGQCISCGNCSTYCEMGIDVKAYAQRGQDIVRASCVGCGICSAVCPRGVLRLENGSIDLFERAKDTRTVHIPETEVKIL